MSVVVGREEGREEMERREGREESSTSELVVRFPPEVQAAIEAVLPSTDPLDQVIVRVVDGRQMYG